MPVKRTHASSHFSSRENVFLTYDPVAPLLWLSWRLDSNEKALRPYLAQHQHRSCIRVHTLFTYVFVIVKLFVTSSFSFLHPSHHCWRDDTDSFKFCRYVSNESYHIHTQFHIFYHTKRMQVYVSIVLYVRATHTHTHP